MHVRPDNPLIVQGDGKVLVETRHTRYEEARDFLSRFAELEASPEHLHTYRIGPLSLWNAAATGMTFEEITTRLRELSKFDIPPNVLETVRDTIFTVEYSVRTAMEAVYTLLDVDRGVPEVFGSVYDVRELLKSTSKLMDGRKPIEVMLPTLLTVFALAKDKVEKNVVTQLAKRYNVL